jgi:hypothetical protein
MRGVSGHLLGVVVLAVLGDLLGVDEKLRERWLSVQRCCWLCGGHCSLIGCPAV